MLELIGKLNGYVETFGRILREDPLKAAGIIALGYVALRVAVAVLRVIWKLRWIVAVAFVVLGVAYIFRDKDVPLLDSGTTDEIKSRIAGIADAVREAA